MFRQWLQETLTAKYHGHAFDVAVPPLPEMGDYSVNLALTMAKKEGKNPREVAQGICEHLAAEGGDRIARTAVAGPGFVNVFLSDSYLQSQVGELSVPQDGKGRKIIVEYSAPNIAKPMHVGHLRSTVIGDALARVHAALGAEVVRWNYVGDWGTQFGKLIAAYKRWGDHDALERAPIAEMVRLYVKFHAELEAHPELEDEGRTEFLKLETGDTENRALWKEFREESLKEFEATYKRLGVSFDVVKGESEYEAALPAVVERLSSDGLAKPSEGALVVDLESSGLPPALVKKTDGATLYLTRDIASLDDRIATYHPDAILYVVANQQALHFEQLFAVAGLLHKKGGMGDAPLPALTHVKYGLVLGEDGKKFSTREGNAVPLAEVLDEVVRRAAERNPETAEAVGVGALKYADLRQHPHTDVVFDWDSMLDLGGNSGPYLQYTYARLAGIAAKAGDAGGADRATLTHPAERALMAHMLDYGYAVAQCAKFEALNGLALHLFRLAELSNRFYEQVRVAEDDDAHRKGARLELIAAVMAQLKAGLGILGIGVLQRI